MKKIVLVVVFAALALLGSAPVSGVSFEERAAENKRKFEQRKAESKLLYEQKKKEMLKKSQQGSVVPSKSELPFDAAKAPPPSDCLMAFAGTIKQARSFSDVIPFIPEAQGKQIQEEQKNYKPEEAAKYRERLKAQSPKLSEEGIEHLTQPPYDRAVKWYKKLAGSIIRVISVKVTGNKAKLKVSIHSDMKTNAYGQWESFPYGTAQVDMLGERTYWKLQYYNTDNTCYKNPQ